MRCLCFGGSFNPIHVGHLICARAVAEAGGFDRVVLFPSAQPPHKPGSADLAPAEDRLAMCGLAAAEQGELFEVEDLELRRSGPSYTIDTAAELRRRGWPEVHWLVGADMLMSLPKWHRAGELLQQVAFVVMARPGWTLDWSLLPEPYRRLKANVIEAPLIQLGATEIRQRVAAGRSIAYLTVPSVVKYIHEHGLYRAATMP